MDPHLRQKIQSGAYEPDPDRVAAAMIARMVGQRSSAVLVAPQSCDGGTVTTEQPHPVAVVDEA